MRYKYQYLVIFLLIWNLKKVKCTEEDEVSISEESKTTDDQSEKEISLVNLNINTKNNTTEYGYSKNNNEGTFVTKDGYGFNKIVKGNTVIWESTDPKIYAYKVVIDGISFMSSAKNIFIHSVDGVKHFKKSSQGDKWEESTPTNVTTPPNGTTPTGSTTSTVPEKSTTTQPETEQESTPIEQPTKESKESNKQPKDSKDPTQSVTNESTKPKESIDAGEPTPQIRADQITIKPSCSESDVKLYAQDQSDPTGIVELGSHEYNIDNNNEQLLKYTFNNNVKCAKFKLKNHDIWSYDNGQEHPKTIYLHKAKTLVFVEFPNGSFNFYRFSVSDNEMKLKTLSKMEDNFESKHKLLTLDSDETSTVELDNTKFDIKKYNFGHEYTFKSGVKCTTLMFNNKEVWKYDSSISENAYPSVVYFLSHFLVLFLKNNKCFFIDPDKINPSNLSN
uniref:SfiI-subtelomeric related protein family member, putative n=1 Tax=Theileria annulata TaxID=5874 RepID=A0A3B0NAT2_THEAN